MKKKAPTKKIAAKKKVKRVVMVRAASSSQKHRKTILRLGFSMRSLHLGTHFFIAVAAFGVLALLGAIDHDKFATRLSSAKLENSATIALEYEGPLSISMLVARKPGAGYASLTNGNQQIVLHVPSSWTRTEVTGASLSDVRAGVPTFGFTSWTLPPRAGIKFSVPSMPETLIFSTTSSATAAINLKTVDLAEGAADAGSRVVLLKGTAAAPLWIGE